MKSFSVKRIIGVIIAICFCFGIASLAGAQGSASVAQKQVGGSKISSFVSPDQIHPYPRSGLLGIVGLEADFYAQGVGIHARKAMRDLGAGATRFSFHWERIDFIPDPSDPDCSYEKGDKNQPHPDLRHSCTWRNYDQAIVDLSIMGVEIIGLIGGTPLWARNWSDHCPGQGVCLPTPGTVNGRSVENYYRRFIKEIASRYNGQTVVNGRTLPRMHFFEYWNEPNGGGYWGKIGHYGYKEDQDLRDYLYWLQQTHNALKDPANYNPDIQLSLGGTDNTATPANWLNRIYTQMGGSSAGYFDAVAHHPYDWAGVIDLGILSALHQSMTTHGDGDKKIWITEYGWTLRDEGAGKPPVTEDQQAYNLILALNELASDPYNFVQFATFHMLFDSFDCPSKDPACGPPSTMYGLLTYYWDGRYHYDFTCCLNEPCPPHKKDICPPKYRKAYDAFRNFVYGDNISFSLHSGNTMTARIEHKLPLENVYLYIYGGNFERSFSFPTRQSVSDGYGWQATIDLPVDAVGPFKVDLIANPAKTLYARKIIPYLGTVDIPDSGNTYAYQENTFVSRFGIATTTEDLTDMRLLISSSLGVVSDQFYAKVIQDPPGSFKVKLHKDNLPGDQDDKWYDKARYEQFEEGNAGGVLIGSGVGSGAQPLRNGAFLENGYGRLNVGESFVTVDPASNTIQITWKVLFHYQETPRSNQRIYAFAASRFGTVDELSSNHEGGGWHSRGSWNVLGEGPVIRNPSFEFNGLSTQDRIPPADAASYWYRTQWGGFSARFRIVNHPYPSDTGGTRSLMVETFPGSHSHQGIYQSMPLPARLIPMVFSCYLKVMRGTAVINIYTHNQSGQMVSLGSRAVNPNGTFERIEVPFQIPADAIYRLYYRIDGVQDISSSASTTQFFIDSVHLAGQTSRGKKPSPKPNPIVNR